MKLYLLLVFAIFQSSSVIVSYDANTETDLGGYKIYYGNSPGSYSRVIDVGNVIEFQINDLSAGSYFFAVTAYDKAWNESDYSEEVSIVILGQPLVNDSLVTDFDISQGDGMRYLSPGAFNIFGMGIGNDSGFDYLNLNQDEIQFSFNIQLTGYGSCVDSVEYREFWIGDEVYLVNKVRTNYTTRVFRDSTIRFNFTDDCWMPDEVPESDANIAIFNLKAVFFEGIRKPENHSTFSLRKE